MSAPPRDELADVRGGPARQPGEVGDLALLALAELDLVAATGGAGRVALEATVDDVAGLPALVVLGLLEDEIFGEVGGVVANMEPCEEALLDGAAMVAL